MAPTETSLQPVPFREYVNLSSPLLKSLSTQTAAEHADSTVARVPHLAKAIDGWLKLLDEDFTGITTDGRVRSDLFTATHDELPVHEVVDAANAVVAGLSPEQQRAIFHDIDARERRVWHNNHSYYKQFRIGIRLDEVDDKVCGLVLNLLKSAMSPEGYRKALLCTETNDFLGQIFNAPGILNRRSYNFAFFGKPSTLQPFGWTFFGHHLCLNFNVHGTHIDITPTFMGAEPNVIDQGPLAGTQLFTAEQDLGLQLMRTLGPGLQKAASIRDSLEPPGGNKRGQYIAVAGAFQDNRIIPPEGVLASAMSHPQRSLLLQIVEQFLIYLPATARRNKLCEVERFQNETTFAWVGDTGDEDPFYYRIQSPVIICEFEHCSGIFLDNTAPKKFHIHTYVRTPNGGDYGYALRPCDG